MMSVTYLIANEILVIEGSPTKNDEHILESFLGTRFWLSVWCFIFLRIHH